MRYCVVGFKQEARFCLCFKNGLHVKLKRRNRCLSDFLFSVVQIPATLVNQSPSSRFDVNVRLGVQPTCPCYVSDDGNGNVCQGSDGNLCQYCVGKTSVRIAVSTAYISI